MENIQVALRIRPDTEPSIWTLQDSHCILTNRDALKRPLAQVRTTFPFDHCYDQITDNGHIYKESVKPLIDGALNGINGTLFMYGQTGSGKTYTMLGSQSDEGVLPLAFKELFETIDNDITKTYVIRCSYFEIYNEQIFDLLKPPSQLSETLQVNEDTKKEFYVKGLTEQSVSSVKEIFEVLNRGEFNRHYAQTAMNHNSSRSHAIFKVYLQTITNNFIRNYRREQSQRQMQTLPEIEEAEKQPKGALVTEGVLNFVDLAGSEKVSANEDISDRVKEGQYINKSLFFLTQVIQMKAEDKVHVPFRNSSLTKILRSSLEGHSRTVIILCANGTLTQFDYTLSTLRFGMNAKKIETKVFANIRNQDDDEALKILLSDYEKKVRDYEKIRMDEKENYERKINQIEKEKQQLQMRVTQNNKQQFRTVDFSIQVTNKLNEYQDLFLNEVGDLHKVAKQNQNKNMNVVEQCSCQNIFKLNKVLNKNYKQLQNNFNKVQQCYLTLMEEYKQVKMTLQQLSVNYQSLHNRYVNLLDYSTSMAQQLTFETFKLSDQQLSQLLSFYQSQLNKLNLEYETRQCLTQIQQFDLKKFQISDSFAQIETIHQFSTPETIDITQIMQQDIQKLDFVEENKENQQNQQNAINDKFQQQQQQQKLEVISTTPIKEDQQNQSILQQSILHQSILQQSNLKHDHSSILSIESDDSIKQTQSVLKPNNKTNTSLSESHFKSVLQSFIQEIDNQPLAKPVPVQRKTPVKYKTPDCKQKKQSISQTSIRGKQNVEPKLPKPKSRSKNKAEELSILLNKAQLKKQ